MFGFAEAWDSSVSSLIRTSHVSQVAAHSATFCPLVLEACGRGWSEALREVVAQISSGSRASRGVSVGMPRDTSLRIAQRISCILHGENAPAILRRFPEAVNGSAGSVGDQVDGSCWYGSWCLRALLWVPDVLL